jgi:hypothetical protein
MTGPAGAWARTPAPWWSSWMSAMAWCWAGQLGAGAVLAAGGGRLAAQGVAVAGLAGGAWMLGRAAVSWRHAPALLALLSAVAWLPLVISPLADRLVLAGFTGQPARLAQLSPEWIGSALGPVAALWVLSLGAWLLSRRSPTSAGPRFPT